MIKLLEENVNIICKKTDVNLITDVMNDAKSIFLNKLKSECTKKYQDFKTNITIDQKNILPETL